MPKDETRANHGTTKKSGKRHHTPIADPKRESARLREVKRRRAFRRGVAGLFFLPVPAALGLIMLDVSLRDGLFFTEGLTEALPALLGVALFITFFLIGSGVLGAIRASELRGKPAIRTYDPVKPYRPDQPAGAAANPEAPPASDAETR